MVRGCPTPVQGQIYEKLKGKTIMKHGIGRKLLSVVLAVMMLVSLLPTAAFADEISSYSAETTTVNENVKPADSEKSSEDTNVGNGGNDVGNNATAVNNSSDDEADKGENKVALQAVAETAVARIGETSYATLKAAINAATTGDTIVLLNDINLTSYQTIGKQLTIDLNGKTITSAAINTIKLTSNADLTVKDSGANGKITNEYKGSSYPATIYLKTAGTTFTLESGTIESDPNETSLQSVAINSDKVACTVNISGGSVTVPEAATEGRGIVAGKGMTLNISGGTITGGLHGVDAYGGSTTNITGGTISARIVDTGVIKEASVSYTHLTLPTT